MKMVLAVVVSLVGAGVAVRGQSAESPLTNAAVIKLARAGFGEKTLMAIIRSRPARFDLAPERLIELKKNGVSEKVILAMLARDGSDASAADIFGTSDDDFFKEDDDGAGSPRRGGGTSNADPNETNIFGSSGGANARTRTRGANGDGQDNTQTNGSATVRILRAPSESGSGVGASPKLEKTPTLKNDSVVEMVEAGFSEGTIIRRIEQSPVEFDLAPVKLAELRRRRVTEPILSAMRAAMGDEADAATPEK